MHLGLTIDFYVVKTVFIGFTFKLLKDRLVFFLFKSILLFCEKIKHFFIKNLSRQVNRSIGRRLKGFKCQHVDHVGMLRKEAFLVFDLSNVNLIYCSLNQDESILK